MANLINNLGGAAGFGENFVPRNDDYYTTGIDLRTIFGSGLNFFGARYNYVSVNNNGNITLSNSDSQGLSTYTPFGLANGGVPIIAPFFADVDTRPTTLTAEPNQVTPTPGGTSRGSDLVWYDINRSGDGVLTVTWDDVGYYSQSTDKLNAFQLQIVGKGGGNFDVIFRYESINWTTGNASGGSGGLGGTIARAGYSTGDGSSWYELPQSGSQDGMLNLEVTPGNTGSAGFYQFSVRSGTAAGELMKGTARDDLLAGAGGNDTIYGYGGNDYLIGNAGADRLMGGAGDDTYSTDGRDTLVEAADGGIDEVLSAVSITLGANLENLRLTGTGDIRGTGNGLANTIAGNSGNNVLDGKAGVDTVDYSLSTSGITLSLARTTAQSNYSQGSDTVLNFENVIGSIYGDTLVGTAGNNVINGLQGADTMTGGNGSDTYYVDNAYDVVTETNSAAAGGRDLVISTLEAYTLGANVEDGRILSSTAANMTGNNLANTIHAGVGDNVLAGSSGADTLSYAFGVRGTTGVTVKLGSALAQNTGGSGTDTVSGFEHLIGSLRNDKLTGNSAANTLNGGGGDDTLSGAAGNDKLQGGGGADRLVGGMGADQLWGGLGNDRFIYTATGESGLLSGNRDIIRDFVRGQDLVDLSGIDAIASTAANNAFTFVGTRGFSGAGQVRYVYDEASNTTTLFGNTDADSAAEFSIQLTGIAGLSSANLVL